MVACVVVMGYVACVVLNVCMYVCMAVCVDMGRRGIEKCSDMEQGVRLVTINTII